LLGADFEQLDFENERGAAGNRRAALVPIREDGRADELRLAADLHLLHALGPTGNHAVERERCGLVALIGAVELGSVNQRAAVVDLHGVGGFGLFAGAGLELLVDQSGFGFDRSGLGGGLGGVGL